MNPYKPSHQTAAFRLFAALTLLILTLFCSWSAYGQDFGTTTGLLQGEHVARSTTLLNRTIRAETVATNWIPFGTHDASLASERAFAPTRFTLFVKLDTAGVAHAAAPRVTLSAEVALSDTAVAYSQLDGSLDLVPVSDPLTVTTGQSMMVPVYGGGWIRFKATADDTVHARLDLWRVR